MWVQHGLVLKKSLPSKVFQTLTLWRTNALGQISKRFRTNQKATKKVSCVQNFWLPWGFVRMTGRRGGMDASSMPVPLPWKKVQREGGSSPPRRGNPTLDLDSREFTPFVGVGEDLIARFESSGAWILLCTIVPLSLSASFCWRGSPTKLLAINTVGC